MLPTKNSLILLKTELIRLGEKYYFELWLQPANNKMIRLSSLYSKKNKCNYNIKTIKLAISEKTFFNAPLVKVKVWENFSHKKKKILYLKFYQIKCKSSAIWFFIYYLLQCTTNTFLIIRLSFSNYA